jgi:anaerobic dimethyl sulfoxide reductase subunit B (iron-sulfur subunit)
LPVGLLWRRVYEVTGGGWRRSGVAWLNDVFAYSLSLACNHCQRPAEAGCVPRARDKVPMASSSSIRQAHGCQHCFGPVLDAPQYDAARGRMTKCYLCLDNLEAGLPPACVAACPLRALDFGELSELQAKHGMASDALPLPEGHFTRPALLIKPHQATGRATQLGNPEEIGG